MARILVVISPPGLPRINILFPHQENCSGNVEENYCFIQISRTILSYLNPVNPVILSKNSPLLSPPNLRVLLCRNISSHIFQTRNQMITRITYSLLFDFPCGYMEITLPYRKNGSHSVVLPSHFGLDLSSPL